MTKIKSEAKMVFIFQQNGFELNGIVLYYQHIKLSLLCENKVIANVGLTALTF